MNRLRLILAGIFTTGALCAQTNVDPGQFIGDTWQSYTISSPGYLGPNAFRIPVNQQGMVDSTSSFMASIESHNTPGDYTQNIFARLYYCFIPGVIAIEAYGIPLEHYRTSDAEFRRRRVNIFDQPNVPKFANEGVDRGDFYTATIFSVLNRPRLPQLAIRFGVRTPSGDLFAARYTDSPGFFTDMSAGKWTAEIRPSAMIGFLTWQTTDQLSFQNDAVIFGLGTSVRTKNYETQLSIDGFAGYKKQLDQPVVGRFQVNRILTKGTVSVQLQQGLHDIKFTTIAIGYTYRFAAYLKQ